jgi:phosphohistidine phosphatase
MALKLYLMRHAQSADKQPGQPDKERELSPEGMRESHQMGAFLLSQKFFFDLFLCSTANRAKSTASLVLDVLKLPPEIIQFDEEIYNASTRTLFAQVTQLGPAIQSVMIIGHNPTLTYLAEYLTKGEIGDMAPAGLAIIHFDQSAWTEINEGTGQLVRYICPEMI